MAATNETSFPERNRGWYRDDLTEINEPMRRLLEDYSKVPSAEVVQHVNAIRERGFPANPYPCIGLYRFTHLTLLTHPLYPSILARLQQPGAIYLDIGCCFGQDLRQLARDGVLSEQLIGLDVEPALMELGYDLFRDRDTLQARFVVADVFQGAATAQGQGGKEWEALESRGVDILHCSVFFHLFPLAKQEEAARQITKLVKPGGGVIVGRQMGRVPPGDVAAIQDGSTSYRHDVTSLLAMWDRVGEATGTSWKVEGTLDMVGTDPSSPVEDACSLL